MKVHGTILSPNVRKVVVALNVKGLNYELNSVLPGMMPPELLAISPRGLIPGFEDGDFRISDSTVIIEYLEDQYPDTPLMPPGAQARARSRWLTEYGGSAVFPACRAIFLQRVANPYMGTIPTDESIVEHTINELLPPILDLLESRAPRAGFLFGDIGMCDISVVSPLINAEYGSYAVDDSRWPKLAGLVSRAKAHPAFAKCLAAEREILTAFMKRESSPGLG